MVKKSSYVAILLMLLMPTFCAAQVDKALHVTAGFGITISLASATHRPTLGFLAGVGAGVGKELWDSTQRGHDASAKDCLATVAGSGAAYGLWKLVLERKRPVKIASTNPPATTTASGTQAPPTTSVVPVEAHAPGLLSAPATADRTAATAIIPGGGQ